MVAAEVETKLEITPVTINVLVESGLIPTFRRVEGRVYNIPHNHEVIYTEARHLKNYADVLEAMRSDGMLPMNAPELLDAKLAAAEEDPIRQGNYTTTSLLAAGKTWQGKTVYVVAHTRAHPFTNPERIRQGIHHQVELWTCNYWATGPLILTDKEFRGLLDMEDGTNSDKKEVYVFSKEEADKLIGSSGTWGIRTSSPISDNNRFLTALVRGDDRKNRLMETLRDYYRRDYGRPQDVYDISGLNDFKRDGDRDGTGTPLARFLSFYGNYGGLLLTSGHFTGWEPSFVGVPQFATQKVPGLKEVVEALIRNGFVKPEDAAGASALLGPIYAEK